MPSDLLSSELSALTELDSQFEPSSPPEPPTVSTFMGTLEDTGNLLHEPLTYRRRRQTPQEKLEKYLGSLRQDSMNVADLLLLLQRSGRQEWHTCVRKLYTPEYSDVFSSLLNYDPTQCLDELQWGMPIYEKELTSLRARGAAFNRWTDNEMKDIDDRLTLCNTNCLKEAERQSPHLLNLIQRLLTQNDSKPEHRTIQILSSISYSRAPRQSNSLPVQIGLYLHSSGVRRRVIEILAKLGVSCSYDTTLKTSKRISQLSKKEVTALGSRPKAVTAYDNFEQTLGVKGERIGQHNEFYSVTTGHVLLGREMPIDGLSQGMLNPSKIMTYPQLFNAPGMKVDALEVKVRLQAFMCTVK